MEELTLAQIQQICTKTLEKFDRICRENNLKYAAAGGTMLGAVRHKGFIPWDDDVDVNMPREDYEKLLKLQYEDGEHKILHYSYCDEYYYTFAKMVDKNTVIVDPCRSEKEMGVYIDIFPVDYVGDIKTEAPNNVKKAWRNSKFWERLGSDINYNKGFSPKYFIKLVFRGTVFPFRKKLLKHFDYYFANIPKSEYCANLQLGTYGLRECFKSSLWDEMTDLEFEDIKVSAFKDYDSYLTALFGDYMTPPPENKRDSTHTFKAYKKQ